MSQCFGVVMLILYSMSLSGFFLSVVIILLQLVGWFQAFILPVSLRALASLYSAHAKDHRNRLLDEDGPVSVKISVPSLETKDLCI